MGCKEDLRKKALAPHRHRLSDRRLRCSFIGLHAHSTCGHSPCGDPSPRPDLHSGRRNRVGDFPDHSVDSLSSLHAAEHFGLGRYSDPIDPRSCFRFMSSLQRVLRPGGRLYFSVPIGRERLAFNAHRVFDTRTVLSAFRELELVSFSFVDDNGAMHEDVELSVFPPSEYACGLFEFTKPS